MVTKEVMDRGDEKDYGEVMKILMVEVTKKGDGQVEVMKELIKK